MNSGIHPFAIQLVAVGSQFRYPIRARSGKRLKCFLELHQRSCIYIYFTGQLG